MRCSRTRRDTSSIIECTICRFAASLTNQLIKDAANLQIVHSIIDEVSRRVLEQRIYTADDLTALNAVTSISNLVEPLPTGIHYVSRVYNFDTDTNGINDAQLVNDLQNNETTKSFLDAQGDDPLNPQMIKAGLFDTVAAFDAASPLL